MKQKKQIMWALITALIAVLTIVAVFSQSKDLTLSDLWSEIQTSNKGFLTLIFLCMVAYIVSEGFALQKLLAACSHPQSLGNSVIYAASDIYCSAITPSATGGQPVCAYFMKRDGVPMGYITGVLTMYLVMHTFATLTMGAAGIITGGDIYSGASILSKILIVLGYFNVTCLAVLFVLLLGWQKTIYKCGCRIIDWFAKKKVIKRPEYWKKRLDHALSDYGQAVKILKGNGKVLLFTYLMNLLQRFCQTIISTLTYLATGGTAENVRQVFASQCFSTMGSVCTPVPGGMGIADYILYDGLHTVMDKNASLQLELLSRSFSFYLMVLISLIIVIVGYIIKKTHYFTFKTDGRW